MTELLKAIIDKWEVILKHNRNMSISTPNKTAILHFQENADIIDEFLKDLEKLR